MAGDNGIPSIKDHWPTADVRLSQLLQWERYANEIQIVYVSIMGTVMLAAFLEWFLWLAAFLYCLVKVFVKAEHWSIRILAVVMMIGFSALRLARAHTTV